MIFAPGFYMEPLKKDLAIDILQITFPYLFLVSLVAFSGSILNSYPEIFLPALTPLFYNLSLIIAAIWFAPKFELPIYAIAWGVFAAGIIQVFIQIPALVSMGLLPKFQLNLSHPGCKESYVFDDSRNYCWRGKSNKYAYRHNTGFTTAYR